jgi:hypothetical protein
MPLMAEASLMECQMKAAEWGHDLADLVVETTWKSVAVHFADLVKQPKMAPKIGVEDLKIDSGLGVELQMDADSAAEEPKIEFAVEEEPKIRKSPVESSKTAFAVVAEEPKIAVAILAEWTKTEVAFAEEEAKIAD